MPLTKPRRFILVQSKANSNANEDNMEPYHISTFRRATSMPPLPRLSSPAVRPSTESTPMEKKNPRLNIELVKKKSAKISERLSNVFRLGTQTIDERFNFEEERFRTTEKFIKSVLRYVLNSIEIFRDLLLAQMKVAEDFEELLLDYKADFVKEFVRSKRFVLEKIWIEFTTHMETSVIDPLNALLQCYVSPSNFISKRNKKLLDYDRAYSSYEKMKDPSLKQTKYQLDLSKRTYEHLNNVLLEELPLLYKSTCQILSLCIPSYLIGYVKLIEQIRLHLRWAVDQNALDRLSWSAIQERFNEKNTIVSRTLFDLNVCTKNGFSKCRYQVLPERSVPPPVPPRSDLHPSTNKPIYSNEIPVPSIFVALYDFDSALDGVLSLRVGEQVKVLRRLDDDQNEEWWYVQRLTNSEERGYVPATYIQSVDH